MLGKLEFNLPEERKEHMQALQGGRYAGAIFDFDQFIRRLDKHRDLNKVQVDLLKEIRDKWNESTLDLIGITD